MEIICNQNELNNAIQLVSKAVASRPTHPILANILLTADEGTNKIKKLVVVVFVATVEFLNEIPCLPSLRRKEHVKKIFYLLNKFKIFEKRKKYSTNRIYCYVLFNK